MKYFLVIIFIFCFDIYIVYYLIQLDYVRNLDELPYDKFNMMK